MEYFIGNIDGFVDTIDYGIMIDNCKSNHLKNIAMKMKMRGKHGELVTINSG